MREKRLLLLAKKADRVSAEGILHLCEPFRQQGILVFLSIMLLGAFPTMSQRFAIEKLLGYEEIQVDTPSGSIRYLCSGEGKDRETPKSVFIYIPESLTGPIFTQSTTGFNDAIPFNHRKYSAAFHFIVLIPKDSALMAEQMLFKAPNEVYSNPFWSYIFEIDHLIEHIQAQDWFEGEIILAGYKMGAHVAARAAQRNQDVAKVLALSMSPLDPYINQVYRAEGLNWGENETALESDLMYLSGISDGCSTFYYLEQVEVPLLFLYGEKDPHSIHYDPVLLEEFNPHLEVKALSALDANFLEIDPWGKVPPVSRWTQVGAHIMRWLRSL